MHAEHGVFGAPSQSRTRYRKLSYVPPILLHIAARICVHNEVRHEKTQHRHLRLLPARDNVLFNKRMQQHRVWIQHSRSAPYDIPSGLARSQHDYGDCNTEKTVHAIEIHIRGDDNARDLYKYDRIERPAESMLRLHR